MYGTREDVRFRTRNQPNEDFISETHLFRLSKPTTAAVTEPSSPHAHCVAETRGFDRALVRPALEIHPSSSAINEFPEAPLAAMSIP